MNKTGGIVINEITETLEGAVLLVVVLDVPQTRTAGADECLEMRRRLLSTVDPQSSESQSCSSHCLWRE